MFELLVLGLPVAVGLLTFGLSLEILPQEVSLRDVAVPKHIEERGYSPLAMSLLLQTRIDKLVERVDSFHEASKIRVGAHRTGLENLAHVFGVKEAVAAMQQSLGMSGELVEVSVNSDAEGSLSATVTVRYPNTLELLAERRLQSELNTPEALIELIAEYVLEITQPYIYASYLYNQALDGDATLDEAVEWIDNKLLDESFERLAELHNLRGLIALDRSNYDMAIRNFRKAAARNPDLARSYTNWGLVWLKLGHPDQAIRYFKLAENAESGASPIRDVYHAHALRAKGDTAEALRLLEIAEDRAPDMAALYEARLEVYGVLGDRGGMEAARSDITRALIIRPSQNYYLPY